MISSKKKFLKRICRIIVIIFLIYLTVSAVSTKLIYDYMFPRYDKTIAIPSYVSDVAKERQELRFDSGKNKLQGYFYDNKGETLVVVAPGFKAGGEDYICQIQAFLDFGYSVFTFDSTGHCKSQGESSVGFSQELLDLDCALDYIEDNNKFGCKNIVLFGHSRGGYASCCVLGYNHEISAVVSVAGVNSAMEGIMEPSVGVVGNTAYGNYPFLWLYQSVIFGADVVNKSAVEEISESDVPVFIIHGNNDEVVSCKDFSIYSHKDEIKGENAKFLLVKEEGKNGHTDILFDKDKTANDNLMDKINQFYRKCLG